MGKTMRHSKAISLALLALTFGAQAATISIDDARTAATALMKSGAFLGAKIGGGVAAVTAHSEGGEDGGAFYAVSFTGGGTVIMSADDEFAPVVAITEGRDIDLNDMRRPFTRLMRYDARARKAWAKLARAENGAKALSAQASSNKRMWAALLGKGAKPLAARPLGEEEEPTTYEPEKPLAAIDDVRVAPLLKTTWSQADAGGGYCYNYYTPNHYVCGCVATATAQVMRYFEWPTNSLPKYTGTCSIGGDGRKGGGVSIQLTTVGGRFDWDKMLGMDTNAYAPEECREAIGHLTYDIGVYIGMHYTAGESGANVGSGFFTGSMGYANANSAGGSPKDPRDITVGLHKLSERQRVIYANLDASRPVLMSIRGYELVDGKIPDPPPADDAAHEVVADGYGYQTIDGEKVDFVHVNMGWGGSDDAWYNLPDVNAANTGATINSTGTDFCFLYGSVCNISPLEKGNLISGRVQDDYGVALAGAEIVATSVADPSVTYTTTSGETGIYAFALPDGEYDIVGTYGALTGELKGAKPSCADGFNSWGNDFILVENTVKVGDVEFSSIDKAYAYAAEKGLGTIEVLKDTSLKAGLIVTTDVSIVAVGGCWRVARAGDICIEVRDGAMLAIDNLVLANASAPNTIQVSDGALELKGTVSSDEILDVYIAGKGAFSLAGAVSGAIRVNHAKMFAKGDVFGSAVGAAAQACAAKIYNAADPSLGGKANGSDLVWDEVAVDPDAAAVSADGECFRSLDALFAAKPDAGTIAVLKSGELTKEVAVTGDLTIIGKNGASIWPAATAKFSVTGGAKLTLKDITVADYSGNASLFYVSGEGSELVLDNGAMLKNICCNAISGACGPVFADNKATLTMVSGASIVECRATSARNNENGGYGGGVYLQRGAVLDMQGGSIVNCHADRNGGGVYAYKSTVKLAGDATVAGNDSKEYGHNIFLAKSGDKVSIVNQLTGGKASVGVSGLYNEDNAPGGEFAIWSITPDEDTLAAFACDADDSLYAEFSDGKVVWNKKAHSEEVDPSDPEEMAKAVVCVKYPDGSETYWTSIDSAFANLVGDATVTLLKDCELTKSIAVDWEVKLTSESGSAVLTRTVTDAGFVVSTGNKLTLENVTVCGSANEFYKPGVSATGRLLDANDASIELGAGATITRVYGLGEADSAVVVYNGGQFKMDVAAMISDCTNVNANVKSAGVVLEGAGTYGDVKGHIVGCNGGNEIPGVYTGRGATADVASPVVDFSITSVDYNTVGKKWSITIAPAVGGHYYKLFSAKSVIAPAWAFVKRQQAETDGELVFVVESEDSNLFWKVEAE